MSEIFEVRPYNSNPYLLFPSASPLRIKLGSLTPTLRAFVYQAGNLFGDPLPLELAGLRIQMRLYDASGFLVAAGKGIVVDVTTAEIEYSWKEFQLKETGVFYAEFLFTDIDDTTFVLPSRERIQVIVF